MLFKYLMMIIITFTSLSAEEYKAVFDCSSSDANYIRSRIWLVGKTMDMIEEQGDTSQVVLTLHSGCVTIVSKRYDEIVPDEDVHSIKQAQDYLGSLSKRKNVKIIACAMSLNANAIEQNEVLPFVHITKNSFIDTIYYQNRGYALMSFK